MGTNPRKGALFWVNERVGLFFAGREPVPPRDTSLSMQTRTKRPTGTWLQATDSVRFSMNSLSTQKMFEVIPPNHAVEMSELLGT